MSLLRRLLLAWLMLLTAVHAQQGGDLQAQILYAFHTEDTNALAGLVQALTTRLKEQGGDKALRYHLAHAHYRLAELQVRARPKAAEAALSDCIDELKPLLEQDAGAAESLILQAACYGALAPLRSVQAVLLRARAAERLASAERLAPHNPRYLLVQAEQGLARNKPASTDGQRAFAQLEAAAAAFEATSATQVDEPGWGHAEAYLLLGTELKLRGQPLQARNWIEKALLLAPDYKAAQRQLGPP